MKLLRDELRAMQQKAERASTATVLPMQRIAAAQDATRHQIRFNHLLLARLEYMQRQLNELMNEGKADGE